MKASRSVLAVLAGLVFSVPLFAEDFVGVITKMDPDKKELLLEGRLASRGRALTLVFDGDTQVMFGKQPGTPAELPIGKIVRVVYETRDSQQVARSIRVNGLRPNKPAAPSSDKGSTITGILRRVALTDSEVVVIGPGAKGNDTETTVAVPQTARIMKGGKAITLESLKEDDQVSIVAEQRDGRLTATAIQVGPAPSSDIVPKLRIAIKIADMLLQKMEKPPQP